MKKREKELLFQFLRNSKLSDREIARKLKTSQSTITRNRHKLEKKIILSYTAVPEFSKLGIELVAFTLGRCVNAGDEAKEKIHGFRNRTPNIIFGGHGEGMGRTMLIVSLHNDFSDYADFMSDLRKVSSGCYENLESFFVPTNGFARTLNFSKAVEYLINKMDKSR